MHCRGSDTVCALADCDMEGGEVMPNGQASVSQNVGKLLGYAETAADQRKEQALKLDDVKEKVTTVCQKVEQHEKDIEANKDDLVTHAASPHCAQDQEEGLEISPRGIKAKGQQGLDMLKIVLAGLIFLGIIWIIAEKHGYDPPAIVDKIRNGATNEIPIHRRRAEAFRRSGGSEPRRR